MKKLHKSSEFKFALSNNLVEIYDQKGFIYFKTKYEWSIVSHLFECQENNPNS